VRFWLAARGIETEPIYVEKILAAAKRGKTLLKEDQVMRMVDIMRKRLQDGKQVTDDDLATA
jgi:hypothetical protein